MQIHFKIIGILLMALALIHVIFPRYFNWKKELQALSLINRQMMTVHTIFIALTVFLMGLLCFTSTSDLIETKLGKTISLGFGIFWGIRFFVQFFGYSAKLWKGKAFETTVHILAISLWGYLVVVFFANAVY
ncbi:hypothetical protein [Maribacter sp. 2210JD10-5]|uniref:hypothetical protein n=1 Tax=Maribacter sp. 2210JD10-5 TaxID=3386272 RepID=UPI0039BC8AF8